MVGKRTEDERDDAPDEDSAGTYFVSVEDFEWRPPARKPDAEPDAPAEELESDGDSKTPPP